MNEPTHEGVYVVLLVDPDPEVHKLVAAALPADCAFLGARTAEIALRVAKKRPPSLAIVADTLPDAPAEQIVASLAEISPSMRAMLLTESRDKDQSTRLLALGTLHRKPLEAEKFREAATNALRFCRMFASVASLRSESINVKTWSGTRG